MRRRSGRVGRAPRPINRQLRYLCPTMGSAFLSHSSNDKPIVRKLAADLTARGHEIWFDEWEIVVGDSITHKLGEGLDRSEFMIVALSPDAVASRWVEREWASAYAKEVQGDTKVILPALVVACEVPALLADKRRVDFARNYTEALEELDMVLSGRRPARPQPGATSGPSPSAAASKTSTVLDRLRAIPIGDTATLHYVPRSRRPNGNPHQVPIVWQGVDEAGYVIRFTSSVGGVAAEQAAPISDVQQAWRPDRWHVRLSGFLELESAPYEGSHYVADSPPPRSASQAPDETFDPYAPHNPGGPGFIEPYGHTSKRRPGPEPRALSPDDLVDVAEQEKEIDRLLEERDEVQYDTREPGPSEDGWDEIVRRYQHRRFDASRRGAVVRIRRPGR